MECTCSPEHGSLSKSRLEKPLALRGASVGRRQFVDRVFIGSVTIVEVGRCQ